MRTFLRETLITVLIAAVIFFGLQTTIQSFVIYHPSMEPNFVEKQRLLVNKVVYNFHDPERGDVIILRNPSNPNEDYIKRIIGLPGESVEIKEGTVYIHKNDDTEFPLDEPYIAEPPGQAFNGDIIPENEYFVLGDNRNNSVDSRSGWTVLRQNIIGKAWLLIWPPDSWGLAANFHFQE
ncbi:signal peptidase I [Chloroflexota bacterium]